MSVQTLLWMSEYILPSFLQKIANIENNVLEKAYELAEKHTKRVQKTTPLHKLARGTAHKKALASIQDSQRSAVKMTLLNPKKVVCVYTNASEALWAAIVTKTSGEHLEKPTEQEQHKTLALIREIFNKLQRNWKTYEKSRLPCSERLKN